jgi:hypothetical protein
VASGPRSAAKSAARRPTQHCGRCRALLPVLPGCDSPAPAPVGSWSLSVVAVPMVGQAPTVSAWECCFHSRSSSLGLRSLLSVHPGLITRRAFGFHSPDALIALAMFTLADSCRPLPR